MNLVSELSDGIVKSEAFTTTRPESTYKTTTKIGKKPKNLLPICKNFHIWSCIDWLDYGWLVYFVDNKYNENEEEESLDLTTHQPKRQLTTKTSIDFSTVTLPIPGLRNMISFSLIFSLLLSI